MKPSANLWALPWNGGRSELESRPDPHRIFTCNFDCVIVTQKAAVRLPEQVMPMDALLYLSYPSEMVRKTGFDSVALCSPSTCSAWLSYFLNKMSRRKTRRRARYRTRGLPVTLVLRLERRWRSCASPRWSRVEESNFCPGAPRPPSFPLAEHTIKNYRWGDQRESNPHPRHHKAVS